MNEHLFSTRNQLGKQSVQNHPSHAVRHQSFRKTTGGVVPIHYVAILLAGQLFAGGGESFAAQPGNCASHPCAFFFDGNLHIRRPYREIVIASLGQQDFMPGQFAYKMNPASAVLTPNGKAVPNPDTHQAAKDVGENLSCWIWHIGQAVGCTLIGVLLHELFCPFCNKPKPVQPQKLYVDVKS
jgi:hypothetical protein